MITFLAVYGGIVGIIVSLYALGRLLLWLYEKGLTE